MTVRPDAGVLTHESNFSDRTDSLRRVLPVQRDQPLEEQQDAGPVCGLEKRAYAGYLSEIERARPADRRHQYSARTEAQSRRWGDHRFPRRGLADDARFLASGRSE